MTRHPKLGAVQQLWLLYGNQKQISDPDGQSPWDWWDRFWGRLGLTRKTWNKDKKAIDWSLCGVYYVNCLDVAMGIKGDLAQAMNSPDPVVYATALATLAQQTNSNSASQLNINTCMANDNCKKALECAKKGLTNPLPFPVRF